MEAYDATLTRREAEDEVLVVFSAVRWEAFTSFSAVAADPLFFTPANTNKHIIFCIPSTKSGNRGLRKKQDAR